MYVRIGCGGVLVIMVGGRGTMAIDPGMDTMPTRRTSDFHRPGGHRYAPSAKTREEFR